MSTHLRSWIVLLAFGACICSASARVFGDAQAPARQPAVTTGVVYGYKDDGLALMLDVYRPARPNGAGVIAIVSGQCKHCRVTACSFRLFGARFVQG